MRRDFSKVVESFGSTRTELDDVEQLDELEKVRALMARSVFDELPPKRFMDVLAASPRALAAFRTLRRLRDDEGCFSPK